MTPVSHPGCDSFAVMDTTPWRDRVREEDELLEQLRTQTSQAARRRANALAEGVTELGSVYAVAKDIGKSWTAVDKAIKSHAGPTAPDTTA